MKTCDIRCAAIQSAYFVNCTRGTKTVPKGDLTGFVDYTSYGNPTDPEVAAAAEDLGLAIDVGDSYEIPPLPLPVEREAVACWARKGHEAS